MVDKLRVRANTAAAAGQRLTRDAWAKVLAVGVLLLAQRSCSPAHLHVCTRGKLHSALNCQHTMPSIRSPRSPCTPARRTFRP